MKEGESLTHCAAALQDNYWIEIIATNKPQ
jgi:hypothetical protein